MLQEAGLCDRGVPGCAEATTTKVNILALKEEWDGEKELWRDLQFHPDWFVCRRRNHN
jgi:hypothetical protein